MDLIGPTPVSARGNHYLLVMTDSRTRYAVAVPLRSKTAEEVVGALTTEWIYRFTPPRRLRCDRGAEFLAEVGRKVYALFGIDFRPSSSFHPNTQGAVERLNQTLWNIVLKMTADDKDDWDLAIPRVLHGYNATPHRVLGISLFDAMIEDTFRHQGAAGREGTGSTEGERMGEAEVVGAQGYDSLLG